MDGSSGELLQTYRSSSANPGVFGQAVAAYLFDATTGNLLQTFANPNPTQKQSFFGSGSLGIRGNLVLTGAPGDDVLAQDNGAAYLFDATTGRLLDTFLRPTPVDFPEGQFGNFGNDVAFLDDNHVIIADFHDDTGANRAGAVYVYKITAIPEPTSITSLLLGFAMLTLVRSRRE